MSRKAITDYELTLSSCDLPKRHVFHSLEDYCQGILVSEEEHHPCPDLAEGEVHGQTHFHCYLQLKVRSTIETLRPTVAISLGGGEPYEGSIHLSGLRNRNHWIKYCTKEDRSPLYRGVDTSLFHFSYKMYDYIRRNPVFDPLACFVRQHVQYTNIIRSAHQKFHADRTRKALLETRTFYPDDRVEWVRKALETLHTGKHLLLWGDTGCGKSVTVKWFLERKYSLENVCYLPCSDNSFEFSNLDDNSQVAYADDINRDYFDKHRQSLLRLLDGGLVTINPKCDRIRQFTCSAQFIFCSNYNCIECTDTAILRRLTVIHVSGNGFSEEIPTWTPPTESSSAPPTSPSTSTAESPHGGHSEEMV